MVFANHINCYDLVRLCTVTCQIIVLVMVWQHYCDQKMVFPDYNPCYGPIRLYLWLRKWVSNHINGYSLATLFIVTRKWSCQTIILMKFPPDYIHGSWSENHVNCCGRPSTRTEKVSCQTRVLRSPPTIFLGEKCAKKLWIDAEQQLRIYGTVRPKGNMCKQYVETIFFVKLEAEQNIVFQNYVLAVYNK